MVPLTEVPVSPVSPDRFAAVLGDRYREMEPEILRAREVLRGRAIWHVNSTARGGGVAEMLHSHLAYVRGAGVDIRWVVIGGDAAFFEVTKRIHNLLHEDPGDGGGLGAAERQIYEAALSAAEPQFDELVRPGDVVFLHDPQTVGLTRAMQDLGARVVWRCHIGIDRPGEHTRRAWEFLLPYVQAADAWVFSRGEFAWEGLDPDRVWLVPPTIDAFSPKNQELGEETVRSILAVVGLGDSAPAAPAAFDRADGTPGRVDRGAAIIQEGPLPADSALVAQISRWDRLKDPLGVLRCFAEHLRDRSAHLALVGPDTEAVSDDPEGAAVLAEVRAHREGLDEEVRGRIHLVSLPMDDLEENAAMVNAIQRRADVVVQKSIAEGFGLTVAEAMWKARPVVATRVGGIQDQIVDGESGFLIDEPGDLAAAAAAIDRPLADHALAERVGAAARERVTDRFLPLGRMLEYFRIIETLIEDRGR